jgi:pre-mRNA-processing factor 40
MKQLVTEPRYWAVQQSVVRKRLFDEYLVEYQKEKEERERQEHKAAIERMISSFESEFSEIKYYTKWRTVRDSLATHPAFQQSSEKDRRIAFKKYIRILKDKYYDELDKETDEAKSLLEQRFAVLKISVSSRWLDTYAIIKKELDSQPYGKLDKIDILTTYTDYIKALEGKLNEERQKEKKIQRRKERKIRESFVELLESLRAEGKIKAGSKWSKVLPLFEKDERYIAICGQPGSSPMELFWDILEEEERKFKVQREIAFDVINTKSFPLTSVTPFESFVEVVKQDVRGNEISQDNLQAIFEDLKSSFSRRRDLDKHADERRLRRNQDSLRYLIRDLEPPVTIDDKWEDVKNRIEDTDEYKSLPTEESRLEAFEKHIRRLKEREQDREREHRSRDSRRDHSSRRDGGRGPYGGSNADYRRPPPGSYYKNAPPPAQPYYKDPSQPYLEY